MANEFPIEALTEWPEYSALCDGCDAESTRTRPQYLAARQAANEGFQEVDGMVFCAKCAAEELNK